MLARNGVQVLAQFYYKAYNPLRSEQIQMGGILGAVCMELYLLCYTASSLPTAI